MLASVNSASVHQENAVNMMQLDMLRLQTLQTQLGNVSMQATLVIGFAIAMLGGECATARLNTRDLPIASQSVAFDCVCFVLQQYEPAHGRQRPALPVQVICAHGAWCGVLSLGSSVRQLLLCERCRLELHTLARKLTGCSVDHRAQIVVTLSAFLKQASQQTALLVSTRASVANTQVHLRLVFRLFVRSISAGFALLIWLFAGLPMRIPFDENAAEQGWAGASDEEYISALDDGGYTITCLDRHSSADEQLRNSYAYTLGGLTTLLILAMCAWGLHTFEAIKRTYEPRTVLSWYAKHRRQQQQERPPGVNKTRPLAASRSEGNGVTGGAYTYSMPEGDPGSDPDSVTGGGE